MKKGRKSKKPATVKVAVAWSKPDQWQRLREISEDRDGLEETYGKWQVIAEKALKDAAARGLPVTKATVDTEELLRWRNERGLKINGESRSQYASWLLQQKDKADRT